MKKILLTLPVLCALISGALAADGKVITLKDGSHVRGELTGIRNGYYEVQSASMGNIRVAPDDIVSITTASAAEQPAAAASNTHAPQATMPADIKSTPEFQAIQNKIISDPALMSNIQSLMQDPEIMAIISDPALLAAIQSGNTAALQSDPRLKRLSENPKIKALTEKIRPQP